MLVVYLWRENAETWVHLFYAKQFLIINLTVPNNVFLSSSSSCFIHDDDYGKISYKVRFLYLFIISFIFRHFSLLNTVWNKLQVYLPAIETVC